MQLAFRKFMSFCECLQYFRCMWTRPAEKGKNKKAQETLEIKSIIQFFQIPDSNLLKVSIPDDVQAYLQRSSAYLFQK